MGSVVLFRSMLWRNSRGRPLNGPTAFIHPCQPLCQGTAIGSWLGAKHDGYRLQIHVRDGRVRLFRKRRALMAMRL